jgi:CheY-like chemotaxis protein
MANILVVDDELGIRDLLSEILNDEGHSVDLAENATQARSARVANVYDLVLLDIWMPDTDGVTLLKEWAGSGLLTMPVIMMSGHATIDTAVDAIENPCVGGSIPSQATKKITPNCAQLGVLLWASQPSCSGAFFRCNAASYSWLRGTPVMSAARRTADFSGNS